MHILDDDGHADQNPVSRVLRTTWGALGALIAASVIGGTAVLWFAGIPSGDTVEDLDKRVQRLETRSEDLEDKQTWVICNSVPQNRPDVLAALQVDCRYDSATRETIRGVPVLKDEDE